MKFLLPLLGALLIFATGALAHGARVGTLEIIHPAIPQPAATAKTAAGYVAITNDGAQADRLIGVETAAAQMAMLHVTQAGADGVATMTHLEGIELPPGETVVLEPGGMHVMLMGLTGSLTEGQMVPATLIFEQAGRVEVEFMVDPPASAGKPAPDHSAHGGN